MSVWAWYARPWPVSRADVRRQAKRETALVSYNNLDATLTGRIIYTLTLTSSFEYDTPESNTYGLRLRISRSHAHVVLRYSFHFSLRIFEQKRYCSQSTTSLVCLFNDWIQFSRKKSCWFWVNQSPDFAISPLYCEGRVKGTILPKTSCTYKGQEQLATW